MCHNYLYKLDQQRDQWGSDRSVQIDPIQFIFFPKLNKILKIKNKRSQFSLRLLQCFLLAFLFFWALDQ